MSVLAPKILLVFIVCGLVSLYYSIGTFRSVLDPKWTIFKLGKPAVIVDLPSLPSVRTVKLNAPYAVEATAKEYHLRYGLVEWVGSFFTLKQAKKFAAEQLTRGSLEYLARDRKARILSQTYRSGFADGAYQSLVSATLEIGGAKYGVAIHCFIREGKFWRVTAATGSVTKGSSRDIYRMVALARMSPK